MPTDDERHSKALEIELISDPDQKARQEALNGLRQYDEVVEQISYWLQPQRPFKLRLSAILSLHRRALEGISPFAGVFRPGGIEIKGSKHVPPGAHLVPEKIEEMCDYINENWAKSTPLHLAANTLWRMNWIHAFVDGNGRTSRVVSYLVLCVRLGYLLPGTQTVPEQISRNKTPYYAALEAADRASEAGKIDLSEMEALLESLLANQLLFVMDSARSPKA